MSETFPIKRVYENVADAPLQGQAKCDGATVTVDIAKPGYRFLAIIGQDDLTVYPMTRTGRLKRNGGIAYNATRETLGELERQGLIKRVSMEQEDIPA